MKAHILTFILALLLTIFCAACGTAPEEEAGSAADNQTTAAYERVLADYRSLYATGQTLGEIDYNDWLENYLDSSIAAHPLVSASYLEFYNTEDSYYYAFHDIDGNGVQELILSASSQPGEAPRPIALYLFDGTEAVMEDLVYHVLLGDGTVLETGNGYVSGNVREISDDGYTLEEVVDSDIPHGVSIDTLNLSAHGGFLADSLSWTLLTVNQ